MKYEITQADPDMDPARSGRGTTPVIDNDLYNRIGDAWWDETQVLVLLRTLLNPARFGYFRRVLIDELRMNPPGLAALDIGCGGGFLAEEFAGLGCRVTGVDPSDPALRAARTHAAQSGLDITYLRAAGEDLPFPNASFNIVYCCDVLEHVSDLDRVIAESARVLRPGGVYLYDTINRTPISKFVLIKVMQEWKSTAIMPAAIHNWDMFIKPRELTAVLARHGFENRELRGMKPEGNPISVIRALRRLNRGRLSYADLPQRGLRFKESGNLMASYMGYGIKR